MFPRIAKIASVPSELIGAAGRRYCSMELLQEKPQMGCVWTALLDSLKFVPKDVSRDILSNFNERIWHHLHVHMSPLLRLPVDIITDRYVKPDDIMVDCSYDGKATSVANVQLTGLENVAYLPNGKCIEGMLAGNNNWRSPEGQFKGQLHKPADIFAFGLVCLYAITSRVICGPDEDFKTHESQSELPAMIRLQRQASYFGDPKSVNGLMKHNEGHTSYQPFSKWPEANNKALKDLIKGTMNLNPSKRLTATETLGCPWLLSKFD
ncbi:hypothetical protein K431DRAFT_322700 [Polychaeton citri CBS 116435]|uniref:Protein kinase domain-containing protein n=1 Tax=Polychaeton citri CBS 116435 TaxID=1314669 RepID=A0A9P4Q427_9PEZI|nr:hypothetical protein K431DRAFT_322700 [Polychaeton citri CBS 116435]